MAEITITLSSADIDAIASAVVAKLAEKDIAVSARVSDHLLWREPDAAKMLGISAQMLKRLRLRGYIKAATSSKPVLYAREHVEAARDFLLAIKKKPEKKA